MLRAYRSGQPLPRVFGWAYLAPFGGWPALDGPLLKGAQITLTSEATKLTTTTLADGRFTLAEAPAGVYRLSAEIPPLTPVLPQTFLIVPEVGCGSQDIALQTTSELSGIVLDHRGQPAPMVPVVLEILSTAGDQYPVAIATKSNGAGRFAIQGVPDTDVRLSYGSNHPSTDGARYPLLYYRGTGGGSRAAALRLPVGDRRTNFVLRLPSPLRVSSVKVKVVSQAGRPVSGVSIQALLSGNYTEFAKSGADGAAHLSCLQGLRYLLDASDPSGQKFGLGMTHTRPVPIVCGKDTGPIEITVNDTKQ
jgi:hypothetical protein